MTNNINGQAYNGIQKKDKIFASADSSTDGKIQFGEANAKMGQSIFGQINNNQAMIEQAIKEKNIFTADQEAKAQELVKKYLGNNSNSFSDIFNQKIGNFKEFKYNVGQIQDQENEAEVLAQIDKDVNEQIEKNLKEISADITRDVSSFRGALDNAIKQAANELNGDSDLRTDDGLRGKEENREDFDATLSRVTYRQQGEEMSSVATFSGAANPKGEVSQGYRNTAAYLEANGAKTRTREVNGQKVTIYEYKDSKGEKHQVTIDDAGQIHNLDKTGKGFLRKSKFTTEDAVADARVSAGITGDSGVTNERIQRRKVDGQYQTVMTYTDKDGKQHARVIENNEVTGQTVSSEVTHVSAGGRAKYTSATSGLSAQVASDDATGDNLQFVNGKVKTGTWTDEDGVVHNTYAGTQRSRGKLDQAGIQAAVSSISASVTANGGTVTDNKDGTYNVNINGHQYTINGNDYKSADRTMRLIQGELNTMAKPAETPTVFQQGPDLNNTYVEDARVDANTAGLGDRSVQGHTGVQYGVNGQHQSNNTTDVRRISYDNAFSRTDFQKQGWKTDKARTKEKAFLAAMDDPSVTEGKKSTRNLKTSNQFAERFIKAYKKLHPECSNNNYDVNKLAKAIKTANPSLFDKDGNMYKNADFARLNLPKDISAYLRRGV